MSQRAWPEKVWHWGDNARGREWRREMIYQFEVISFFIIYLFFAMKAFLHNDSTFSQIQNRLNKYPFLSKNHLPGYPDAFVFLALASMHKHPDPKQHPHFYHWFILIKQFSLNTINSWLTKQAPCQEDHLINHLLSLDSQTQQTTQTASVFTIPSETDVNNTEGVVRGVQTQFLLDVWQGQNRSGRWESMKRELRPLGVTVQRDVIGRQTRLSFQGDTRRCEQVLQIVDKWLEYRSIEVKKQRHSKSNK